MIMVKGMIIDFSLKIRMVFARKPQQINCVLNI